MSLGGCRECGHSISDLADVCPHCGAPAPTKERSKTSTYTFIRRPNLILAVGQGIALCVVLLGVAAIVSLIPLIGPLIAIGMVLFALLAPFAVPIAAITGGLDEILIEGACPHCAATVRVARGAKNANCASCLKPLVIGDGQFVGFLEPAAHALGQGQATAPGMNEENVGLPPVQQRIPDGQGVAGAPTRSRTMEDVWRQWTTPITLPKWRKK